MGISRIGEYTDDDLLHATKKVEKFINNKTKSILELASGRGATSFYLANKHNDIRLMV